MQNWVRTEFCTSFKGLPEPLTVGHLGKRLTLLPTSTNPLRRIAERDNCQYVEVIRDAQERLDLGEPKEAHPV